MARALAVEIVGDSRQLERAFQRSTRSARKFNTEIIGLGRGGVAASGLFRGLGRSIAFASASFLGGAGLIAAVKSSVEAASNLEEQVSKTNIVFADSGQQVIRWSKTLINNFGLSETAALTTASSIGALLHTVGIIGPQAAKQSEKLTQLGADLAAFYNTSVQDALDAIQSGLVGQVRPLRRYAINLSAARVQAEALSETGKKNAKNLTDQEKTLARLSIIYKDSSLAQGNFSLTSGQLAQKLKIAQANIEQMQAALGSTLVPVITKVVSGFNEWIGQEKNRNEVMRDTKIVVGVVVEAFTTLKTVFEQVDRVTGSLRNTLKLLFAVWLSFKFAGWTASVVKSTREFGKLHGAFDVGRKRAFLLKGVMAGDAGLIAAVGALSFVLATAAINALHLDDNLNRLGGTAYDVVTRLHFLGVSDPTQQFKGTDIQSDKAVKFLRRQADKLRAQGMTADQAADELVRTHQRLARHDALVFAGATGAGPFSRAATTGFATVMDALAAAIKRAKKLKADADAAGAGGHDRNAPGEVAAREAFRQLMQDKAALAVERAGLTKTLTDDLAALNKYNALLKRRIKGGHDTIALEREQISVQGQINDLLAQQAQQAKDARAARQFRILGFGPQGQDLVPGVSALRRRAEALRKAISGTFLDTNKNRGLIANIVRVLKEGLNAVSEPVRAKIKEMLDDLAKKRKQLSGIDAGLRQRTPSGQFVGPGARGTLVIQGGLHLHGIHNVKEFEEALARRSGQRFQPRRVR